MVDATTTSLMVYWRYIGFVVCVLAAIWALQDNVTALLAVLAFLAGVFLPTQHIAETINGGG